MGRRRLDELYGAMRENAPELQQMLSSYLHQDWPIHSGTPEAAVDDAIAERTLAQRQAAAKELRWWHEKYGSASDVRDIVNDGFHVNVYFRKPQEAHDFMGMVYEKMIASIKADTEKWPS